MGTKNKQLLLHHSLFQNKREISSKSDLIDQRLEKYGDKIIVDIALSNISIKQQPRKTFDQQKIKDLANNIQSKGLIHPITVMKNPQEPHKYILLIGENRFQAMALLGRTQVPCIVKEYTEDDVEIKLIQLAENMHRTDINPVEMADALMEIKEKSSFTLQQIATAVGRNIDSIKQYSRISKLSHQEKTHHIQNQSSKNDILLYLAKSEKKPNNELQLVKQKNKITLKTISIHTNGKNKDSKESLEEKIKIANAFIKEAQTLLNTPK